MQSLLKIATSTLHKCTALLDRQRDTVQALEARGWGSDLARGMYSDMATIVETLRWNKAWIEQRLRDNSYLEFEAQPHPWSERPPADLLALVCTELQTIVRDDPAVEDPAATDRAVWMAIRRASQQR